MSFHDYGWTNEPAAANEEEVATKARSAVEPKQAIQLLKLGWLF